MGNNAHSSFKEKLFAILLCLALILPFAPIGAQETDEISSDDTWSDKNWPDDTGADITGTAVPNETAPEDSPGTAASGETPKTAVPKEAPKTTTPKATPKTAPKIQGVKTVTGLINQAISYISQIGSVFGKTTGIRIGGTSVSGIVMLAIAKLIRDRAPSWVKWLLYASGGTMIAGSGANITQMIMQFL
jgi:hypothetical protein